MSIAQELIKGRQMICDGKVEPGDLLACCGDYWEAHPNELGLPIEDYAVCHPEYEEVVCYREMPVAKPGDMDHLPPPCTPMTDADKHADLNAVDLPESAFTTACRLVLGERNDDYGSPRGDFEGIAKMWSGLLHDKLESDITCEEALLMMEALKLRREARRPKRDNLVDAYGYLLCYEWATTGERPGP
jgi:hypothetical protein